MDDLVVNNQLAATVVDDEGTDGATAVGEGLADALEETTLGDDGQSLLDVTGLGHGSQGAVGVDVQDAVGLEDGAEHGLDNNGGRGVGDEAGLLLELAGEQVNTEVTVLAGLGGDGDADHLARTALEDQDVANADEVAGDSDSLAGGTAVAGLNDTDSLAGSLVRATGLNNLVTVVEGVHDAVGSTLNAAAERVVLTLVVVVTHLASLLGGLVNLGSLGSLRSLSRDVTDGSLGVLHVNRSVVVTSGLLNLDLATSVVFALVGAGRLTLVGAVVRVVGGGAGRLLVLEGLYGVTTLVGAVDVVVGRSAATVVSLSDVKLSLDNGLIVDLGTFLKTNRRLLLVVGVAKR